MGLKDSWKKVGGDFAALGKDLGKSIVKTVRKGAEAASDWAERDDERIAEELETMWLWKCPKRRNKKRFENYSFKL